MLWVNERCVSDIPTITIYLFISAFFFVIKLVQNRCKTFCCTHRQQHHFQLPTGFVVVFLNCLIKTSYSWDFPQFLRLIFYDQMSKFCAGVLRARQNSKLFSFICDRFSCFKLKIVCVLKNDDCFLALCKLYLV